MSTLVKKLTRFPVGSIEFRDGFRISHLNLCSVVCPNCGKKDVFADESNMVTTLVCKSSNTLVHL